MNDEFRVPVLSSLFGLDSAFIIPNSAFGLSRLQSARGSAAFVVEDDTINLAHVARRGPRHFPDRVVKDDGIDNSPSGFFFSYFVVRLICLFGSPSRIEPL
jgi:hypothetical protein